MSDDKIAEREDGLIAWADSIVLTPVQCLALWTRFADLTVREAREWYPPRRMDAIRHIRAWGHEPTGWAWVMRVLGYDLEAVWEKFVPTLVEPTEADWKRYSRLSNAHKARFDHKKFIGNLTRAESGAILRGEDRQPQRGEE